MPKAKLKPKAKNGSCECGCCKKGPLCIGIVLLVIAALLYFKLSWTYIFGILGILGILKGLYIKVKKP